MLEGLQTVEGGDCGFWARSSSVLSWRLCLRRRIGCWTTSSPSRIFSALGYSSCSGAVLEPTTSFAAHHDAPLRRCLSRPLGVAPDIFWDLASLPLSLGGLCLRSATLLSRPAFSSSWADCLDGATKAPHRLCSYYGRPRCSAPIWLGFHAPSWQELAAGVRPEQNLASPVMGGIAEPQNMSMASSCMAP